MKTGLIDHLSIIPPMTSLFYIFNAFDISALVVSRGSDARQRIWHIGGITGQNGAREERRSGRDEWRRTGGRRRRDRVILNDRGQEK